MPGLSWLAGNWGFPGSFGCFCEGLFATLCIGVEDVCIYTVMYNMNI